MTNREAIISLQGLFEVFDPTPTWHAPNELALTKAKRLVNFDELRKLRSIGILCSFENDVPLQLEFDSGKPGDLPISGSITLRLPRLWEQLVIARDFDDLLSLPLAHEKTPAAYFLFGSKNAFVKGDDISALPYPLNVYHWALRLWETLKLFADHEDETGSLLFFGTRRIHLLPVFSKTDLMDLHWMQPIIHFMCDSDRADTRKEIILAVLADMLRDQTPEQSFAYLLTHTEVLNRQLKEGMSIYLSEHSPEKLSGEARLAAIALSDTLEKIIAGLEAKGLTVPAAILLGIKDLQSGGGLTLANALILLSLAVFAVTMWIIHLSQHDLINQLHETIDASIKEIQRKGLASDNPVIKNKFSSLKKRSTRALCASSALRYASLIPFVVVAAYAFYGHQSPIPTPPTSGATPAKATTPLKQAGQ